MRVVVVGGGGLTGQCSVRDLATSGTFDQVVAADLDLGLAERAARAAGPGRARPSSMSETARPSSSSSGERTSASTPSSTGSTSP